MTWVPRKVRAHPIAEIVHLIFLKRIEDTYWCVYPFKHLKDNGVHRNKPHVIYRQNSNISRTLAGNRHVDHSDTVGASPVGVAPTTSLFSTEHLAWIVADYFRVLATNSPVWQDIWSKKTLCNIRYRDTDCMLLHVYVIVCQRIPIQTRPYPEFCYWLIVSLTNKEIHYYHVLDMFHPCLPSI